LFPPKLKKIEEVEMPDNMGAVITTKKSKKTENNECFINVNTNSPEDVVAKMYY
jgi:hypothetical protein